MSKLFGHTTHVYKGISSVDGNVYILRRLEGFKLVNDASMTVMDYWNRISHPNVVSLREAFTTKAFNDDSMMFVYDYHPLAETLAQRHFPSSSSSDITPSVQQSLATSTVFVSSSPQKSSRPAATPVTEHLLWSYIVQILSALKAIHSSGLACRTLEPSKVLVSGKSRVRVNCVGIFDVMSTPQKIGRHQQEDLLAFGQLILCLACNQAVMDVNASLEHVTRNLSKELKALVFYLLGQPSHTKSVDELTVMLAPRILNELAQTYQHHDIVEDALMRELENGRLVRLLCKLGFINERPEFDLDPHWSETGDRYLLKLLRDYIFHQVDTNGKASVDMGHVLRCLNKLDAGSCERIMLTSRDEQSCLVVSYRDLKSCIDVTFAQFLTKKGTTK